MAPAGRDDCSTGTRSLCQKLADWLFCGGGCDNDGDGDEPPTSIEQMVSGERWTIYHSNPTAIHSPPPPPQLASRSSRRTRFAMLVQPCADCAGRTHVLQWRQFQRSVRHDPQLAGRVQMAQWTCNKYVDGRLTGAQMARLLQLVQSAFVCYRAYGDMVIAGGRHEAGRGQMVGMWFVRSGEAGGRMMGGGNGEW